MLFVSWRRWVGVALCFWVLSARAKEAPAGLEIVWDTYGVAHVYAPTVEGLFFGYGYAQMQSHGNLVLKLYGESRGRAAEYWGPAEFGAAPESKGNVENDRWVQLNEVPTRSAAWYAAQTPAFRGYLDAFAAGMNAYAERHPEAIAPERRVVLPITGVDPLQHVHRIVHFTYMSSAARVPAAVKERTVKMPGEGEDPYDSDHGAGSNAWAIAPKRTADGKALLLMNPHLPWGDWSTYYESHLTVPSLGINLSGASQIGFPVLRFVFSDYLGFTQTVNGIDGSDLYKLTPGPDKDTYVFDGKTLAYETASATFTVRQPDGTQLPEVVSIRKSVHGPVVWDKDGLVLAQRTAGLDRPHLLEQYWQMAIARTFADYEAQLKRLEVPTFNITYADRAGHVMYFYNGTWPKRASGNRAFWAGIVPGDTAKTLWTGYHSYEELPKVIDPDTGWVQNTNDPPYSATYPRVLEPQTFPAYAPGTDYTFRSIHSIRLLHEQPRFTFETLIAYKHDTGMELAARVLPDLLAAVDAHGDERVKAAAAVLRAWDRKAEATSRGALLFQAWASRFMGESLTSLAGFAVPLDAAQPLTTPRGLKDPAKAAADLALAADETEKRYGALDAPWGDFMRFQIGAVDLPGNGATGSLGAFRVMRFAGAKGKPQQKAIFGDTFVACVEFGETARAQVLTSYGTSSQPGSPHQADQLALLSEKRLRPALRTRAEVDAAMASIDRF